MPKNVLVLGAGMISPPLLRYLVTRTPHRLLVGALDVRRAEAVFEEYGRGRAVTVDIDEPASLEPLVREADAVVSLLPAPYNPAIARRCIGRGIPFVNTSYVSSGLEELDDDARRAGVLLLSETGLDPGIDHMSAVRLVRRVKARGGSVLRLSSCCGGFPAPDANDNPWGYKFSWFPRAVLLAGRNPARYLRRSAVVEVPGPELFSRSWPYEIEGLGVFEVYPNRDSLRYRDAYGLGDVDGLFRGTIRYPGWCATMRAAADLGLLDVEVRDWPQGTTFRDLVTRLLPPGPGPLVERLAARLGIGADDGVLSRLEWAGLLSDRLVTTRRASAIDLFAERLLARMTYRPGERDMVALEHKLTASFPDGHVEEVSSSLVATGEPWGDSAMSRTVALPAAIATRLVLDGAIGATGLRIPTLPELSRPVLDELADLGLPLVERLHVRFDGPLDEPERRDTG